MPAYGRWDLTRFLKGEIEIKLVKTFIKIVSFLN
jgi:hypothetical protein